MTLACLVIVGVFAVIGVVSTISVSTACVVLYVLRRRDERNPTSKG